MEQSILTLQNKGVLDTIRMLRTEVRLMESDLNRTLSSYNKKLLLFTDISSMQNNEKAFVLKKSKEIIEQFSPQIKALIDGADKVPEVYSQPEFQKSFAQVQTSLGYLYARTDSEEESENAFLTALRHESSAKSKMPVYTTLIDRYTERNNTAKCTRTLVQMLEEGFENNRTDNGNTVLLKAFFDIPMTAQEKITMLQEISPASHNVAQYHIILGHLYMRLNNNDSVHRHVQMTLQSADTSSVTPYLTSLLQDLINFLSQNAR